MFASLFAPDPIVTPEDWPRPYRAIPFPSDALQPLPLKRMEDYQSPTEPENKKEADIFILRDVPVYRSLSGALDTMTISSSTTLAPLGGGKRIGSVPTFWPEDEPKTFLDIFHEWLNLLDHSSTSEIRIHHLKQMKDEIENGASVDMQKHAAVIRVELLLRLTDRTWSYTEKDWIYGIYSILDGFHMWDTNAKTDSIPEEYVSLLMKQFRVAEMIPIVTRQMERGLKVSWMNGIITEGQYLIHEARVKCKNPAERAILKDCLHLYRGPLIELIGAQNDPSLVQ